MVRIKEIYILINDDKISYSYESPTGIGIGSILLTVIPNRDSTSINKVKGRYRYGESKKDELSLEFDDNFELILKKSEGLTLLDRIMNVKIDERTLNLIKATDIIGSKGQEIINCFVSGLTAVIFTYYLFSLEKKRTGNLFGSVNPSVPIPLSELEINSDIRDYLYPYIKSILAENKCVGLLRLYNDFWNFWGEFLEEVREPEDINHSEEKATLQSSVITILGMTSSALTKLDDYTEFLKQTVREETMASKEKSLSAIDKRVTDAVDVLESKAEEFTSGLDEVYQKNKDKINDLFDKSIDVVYLEKINELRIENKSLVDRVFKLERQVLRLTKYLEKLINKGVVSQSME